MSSAEGVTLVVVEDAGFAWAVKGREVRQIIPAAQWPNPVTDVVTRLGHRREAASLYVLLLEGPHGEIPVGASARPVLRTYPAAEILTLPDLVLRGPVAPLLASVVMPTSEHGPVVVVRVDALATAPGKPVSIGTDSAAERTQ